MFRSSLVAGGLAVAALAATASTAHAEERVLWLSIGDGLGSSSASARQTAIDNAIDFATDNGFNAISLLTRYRANAFYIPNRTFDTFTNPEPRAWDDGFDELQYTIDNARPEGLRVYAAWSAFLVTDGSNVYPEFLDDDWRMWIYEGQPPASSYNPDTGFPRPMVADDPSASGLWVDPGIPEVRDYTIEVLLDLVENYDIDAVVLDRIRYPGDAFNREQRTYGHTPDALAAYGLTNPPPSSNAFIQARRDAITDFLSDATVAVHEVKPWVAVGATPVIFVESTNSTYNFVYQYVPDWSSAANPNHTTGQGAVSFIMPQYYRDGDDFSNIPGMNALRADIDNMVHLPTFRAFSITSTLAEHVAESICETQQQEQDEGWGIFSYSGLTTIIDDINNTNTACGSNLVSPPAPDNVEFDIKTGWDSTPPGDITDLVADSSEVRGGIYLTWSAPAGAEQYLVYRSASSPVEEVFANKLTPSPINANGFVDRTATGLEDGVEYHYKAIPLDGFNNRGGSNEASATAEVPTLFVRSREPDGGLGARYEDNFTGTQNSTAYSTAPGNAPGGSRFTTTVGQWGRFSPDVAEDGFYTLDVTLHNASSHNANADVELDGTFATLSEEILLSGPEIGNVWTQLHDVPLYLQDGRDLFDDFIRFTYVSTPGGDRMNLDGLRLRYAEDPENQLRPVGPGDPVVLEFLTLDSRAVTLMLSNLAGIGAIQFSESRELVNHGTLDADQLVEQEFAFTVSGGADDFASAEIVLPYSPDQLGGLSNDADGLNAVFRVDSGGDVTIYTDGDADFDHANNQVTVPSADGLSFWFVGNESAAETSVGEWWMLY